MVKKYVPERGDVVWIDLDLARGHEQQGRRPALVVSKGSYNAITGVALFVHLTTKSKGYPFEIIGSVSGQKSAVLADQIKSMDWQDRNVSFIEKTDDIFTRQVLAKIISLFN